MGNTVYITGASGLVARYVITELSANSNCNVIAISSCPEVVSKRHSQDPRVKSIGYDDFFEYGTVNQ